jgi:hypothetical protein
VLKVSDGNKYFEVSKGIVKRKLKKAELTWMGAEVWMEEVASS